MWNLGQTTVTAQTSADIIVTDFETKLRSDPVLSQDHHDELCFELACLYQKLFDFFYFLCRDYFFVFLPYFFIHVEWHDLL